MDLVIEPLTAERWSDFESLFGPGGQLGGCWCMWNRQTNKEFDECKGATNKAAMRALVDSGEPIGLLAYLDGQAIGWVSVGPRSSFSRLQRSPVTKPVDDLEVWSVTCFVIAPRYRDAGVAGALLDAAVAQAREAGVPAIEGYPVEPRKETMPAIYAWMGIASMFDRAGFTEIARRSETRPLYRLDLTPPSARSGDATA